MPSHVNFITGNANKLNEVKAILEAAGIAVQSQNLDLEEVQGTIEQVTESKARRAAEQVGGPVLVDDTSLCFNALHGLPGPYIKWFMASIGHQGLNDLLAAYEDKSAEAVATFGYCEGPGKEVKLFQGRCPVRSSPLTFLPYSLCSALMLGDSMPGHSLIDVCTGKDRAPEGPNDVRLGRLLRVRGEDVSSIQDF